MPRIMQDAIEAYERGAGRGARDRGARLANAGDYDGAAAALRAYDSEGATAYERRAYGQHYGAASARNDFDSARNIAARYGDPAGVQAAREGQQELDADGARVVSRYLAELEELDAAPEADRAPGYAALIGRARTEIQSAGGDASWLDQLPQTYSPMVTGNLRNRLRGLLGRFQTPAQMLAQITPEAPDWQTNGTRPYYVNRRGQTIYGEGEIPHRPQAFMQPGGYRLVQPEEAEARGLPPAVYQENERTGQMQPLAPPRAQFTEGQTAAAAFALRMRAADQTMRELENSHRTDQQFWNDLWTVGAVGLGGPDVQRYRQALREFQNSILRRESGAVIGASEFASARQQYAPNPLTDPRTLEQNRAARQRSIEGLEFQSQGATEDLRERQARPAPARQSRTPTPQAIQYLRQHPDTAPQFEAHYGLAPGGAQSFMRDGPDQ